MNRLRPFVIGAALGAAGLAALPLVGLHPHGVRATEPFAWHHWLSVRQSVTLRSLLVVPPPLDDPARVRRAAGHYELVCAACHGSPAAPPARMAADLAPPPPPLMIVADRWRPDARLFQTIKHGVRNTAMPAWPTDARDDEVWDMVAFLRELPRLDSAQYRALAGVPGDCTHCHGPDGTGRDGMPRLDTLSPAYIAGALRNFRQGLRPSGPMMAIAHRMSEADVARHATAFGPAAPRAARPADDGTRAARLALQGDPARDIPACLSCHETGDPAIYPAILGQQAEYLRRQLRLFTPEEPGHAPRRTGTAAHVMAEAARALTPADIDALADWLAQQGRGTP